MSALTSILLAVTLIFVLPACAFGWTFWRLVRGTRPIDLQDDGPGDGAGDVATLARIDGAMAELEALDQEGQWIG